MVALTKDEQRASNERAQVAEVFGLTGGELMDVAWVPTYERNITNTLTATGEVVFTYWHQGVPDYLEGPEWHPTDAIFRTVCEDEMFGYVPQIVTGDEGTWRVVARYRNSGETECPGRSAEPGSANAIPATAETCPLCDADLMAGESHGYIYIGDGWAEIVYRLEEIQRATPTVAGCWVDGHWGQYAIAHMVEKAQDWGYADAEVIDIATRHLATIGPSEAPQITDDEHQALSDASDEVEAWLNEHVAPEGFSFGWWEGEFFLNSDAQWAEAYGE